MHASARRREIAVSRADLPSGRKRPPLTALLGAIGPFSAFTPAELADLAEHLAECPVKDGSVVVRQGDAGGSVLLRAEGALGVRVSRGSVPAQAVDVPGARDVVW